MANVYGALRGSRYVDSNATKEIRKMRYREITYVTKNRYGILRETNIGIRVDRNRLWMDLATSTRVGSAGQQRASVRGR